MTTRNEHNLISDGGFASASGAIRLADLLRISTEDETSAVKSILERWNEGTTSRITVGGLGDQVTEIDIIRDGPHGLVGGTTRSGKTEFLKSLLTGLAVANHPDDLAIVIIDFKGGIDHQLSARLPHVLDLVTNQNVELFVRNVRLIEAEMERRQQIFAAANVSSLDAYRAARLKKPSMQPIPRLLIVIDGFSELLSTETGRENLNTLASVSRIGGGLGAHLMLVNQSFENQLPPQIAANAGLRICFRALEESQSEAVLGSAEAASIPKEHVGRAYLRSHGAETVEFQSARVTGPRPALLKTPSDGPPTENTTDVPASDTDMYAIVEAVARAAAQTGWKRPAMPWPGELPTDVSVDDVGFGGDLAWPVGLLDVPEKQEQRPIGLEADGPHTLFIGGGEARLGEVLRAVVVSGAMRKSPEELHFYVIASLDGGLSSLSALPHTGGIAVHGETLGLRIVDHVANEVARRSTLMSELGLANIQELRSVAVGHYPDVLLVVHGADTLIGDSNSPASPLYGPLLKLMSDAIGTGVRVLMSGTPRLDGSRLTESISRRFVFECDDRRQLAVLDVPFDRRGAVSGFGRAVDLASGCLTQFASVPATPETPAADFVKAIGRRLTDRWDDGADSSRSPVKIREVPWPLPLRFVPVTALPAGVDHPVSLCVNPGTGELVWLDAAEDGPVFVVCGPPKSGRSNTLIVSATLMSGHGWKVLGLPLSKRSPMNATTFPGTIISEADLASYAAAVEPIALFMDDAHRWSGDANRVRDLLDGPGPRAVIVAGPSEFFSKSLDLVRSLGPLRSGIVLAPNSRMNTGPFDIRRLNDEVLRDSRSGRGILVVVGEICNAQVPLHEAMP